MSESLAAPDAQTTLGIDLASQPSNTAVCLIQWQATGARVEVLGRGHVDGQPLDDERLLGLILGHGGFPPAKVGIDAPLGWPVTFVEAMTPGTQWPIAPDESRARLTHRATDEWVHTTYKKRPLSVSTDRIAYPAMRAAGMLSDLRRRHGWSIDLTGRDGAICEVYPDPAIREFELWPDDPAPRVSYKGDHVETRRALVEALVAATSQRLTLTLEQEHACIASDDCLDALICALVARAASKGLTVLPSAEHEDLAAREGWIHIPKRGTLPELF